MVATAADCLIHSLPTSGPEVAQLAKVSIACPDLCSRYTARVIRGVKIGPSPAWLAHRLQSIGMAVINNVVDVSNYVMMECGQPLHVFDLRRLEGRRSLSARRCPTSSFPPLIIASTRSIRECA